MAIKFSELRGLLKDTNIQTVKMSDPVYSTQMEKITYGKEYSYTIENQTIKFKNLNNLKTENKLWLINQLMAYTIKITVFLEPYVFNTTKLVLNKLILFQFYKQLYSYNEKSLKENGIPHIYWLENNFYMDENKSNISNPRLTRIKITNGTGYTSFSDDVFANKYYNSKWNILNEAGSIYLVNPRIKYKFYDYEMIDNDANLQSSVLLYTSPITNRGYLRLLFYLGYKPNDKFTKRYISAFNIIHCKIDSNHYKSDNYFYIGQTLTDEQSISYDYKYKFINEGLYEPKEE